MFFSLKRKIVSRQPVAAPRVDWWQCTHNTSANNLIMMTLGQRVWQRTRPRRGRRCWLLTTDKSLESRDSSASCDRFIFLFYCWHAGTWRQSRLIEKINEFCDGARLPRLYSFRRIQKLKARSDIPSWTLLYAARSFLTCKQTKRLLALISRVCFVELITQTRSDYFN